MNVSKMFFSKFIYPKTPLFLFDSFGVFGLRKFTIQQNKETIKDILFGTEKWLSLIIN